MRLYLQTATGAVRVRGLVEMGDTTAYIDHVVQPGQAWGGLTYDRLKAMGPGAHDIEPPAGPKARAMSETRGVMQAPLREGTRTERVEGVMLGTALDWSGSEIDRLLTNFRELSMPRPGSTAPAFRVPLLVGCAARPEQLRQNTGYPASGWLANVWRESFLIKADVEDVPPEVAALLRTPGMHLEAELYDDYRDEGGSHGPALRRVVLVSGKVPCVTRLSDIPGGTPPIPRPKGAGACACQGACRCQPAASLNQHSARVYAETEAQIHNVQRVRKVAARAAENATLETAVRQQAAEKFAECSALLDSLEAVLTTLRPQQAPPRKFGERDSGVPRSRAARREHARELQLLRMSERGRKLIAERARARKQKRGA